MRLAVQWIQPRANAVRREYTYADGTPGVTMTYNYQEEAKKRQLSVAKATLRKTLSGEYDDEQTDRISLEELESARQRLIKENQSNKSYALRKAKKELEDTLSKKRIEEEAQACCRGTSRPDFKGKGDPGKVQCNCDLSVTTHCTRLPLDPRLRSLHQRGIQSVCLGKR